MEGFSIERSAEDIPDPRTRELFREVQTCYSTRSFRSALVMLWTVVICDLLWKLQDLRDVHGDGVAGDILDETKRAQEANPESPAWELKLVQAVRTRTHLLESAEHQAILNLQQLRHLSAHPVLTEASLLHQPNGDTVRACIREALAGVLLKPPIFTKQVISTFLEDLAAKKDLLIEEATLEKYIKAKYFPRLTPVLEDRLFRSLWKLVFRTENEKTTGNRLINMRALKVLARRRPNELADYVGAQPDYFSEISSGQPMRFLAEFLTVFPRFYVELNGGAKAMIEEAARRDLSVRSVAWFLGTSREEHLASLEVSRPGDLSIDEESWDAMLGLGDQLNLRRSVLRVGISQYTNSHSYNGASVPCVGRWLRRA